MADVPYTNVVLLRGEVTGVLRDGHATIYCGSYSFVAYLPAMDLQCGDHVALRGELRDGNAPWILSARRLNGDAE